LRFVAADVREGVVTNVGYWLMEEEPAQTIALIRDVLGANGSALRAVLPAMLPGKLCAPPLPATHRSSAQGRY